MKRLLPPLAIGFLGALVVWVVTPINNFTLDSGYISDSFLPVAAIAVMLLVVLVLNPITGLLSRKPLLDRGQLALVFGILLVSSAVASSGLMRLFPYTLARTVVELNSNPQFSQFFGQLHLPAFLFPGTAGYGAVNPAAEKLFLGLSAAEAIPWAAWIAPVAIWGVFIAFLWLMVAAMAILVYPQWKENENLSFPLLEVQESFIDLGPKGGFFPAIFRSRGFWIGFLAIAALHSMNMLAQYFPERVPAIPLSFDLKGVLTEPPFIYLQILTTPIYFVFVAMAFFMPSRAAFSIWFFTLAYNFYIAFGRMYVPTFSPATATDHRSGAMLLLTFWVLWLGRTHWAEVFASMIGRVKGDKGFRDGVAGWLFVIALMGMSAWLLWLGVGAWAFYFVFNAFMISFIMMRFVAETGAPFMRIDTGPRTLFMDLFPSSWMNKTAIYFSAFGALFTSLTSRSNMGVLMLHALGMNRDAGERRKPLLAFVFLAVALAGLILGGAMHLVASYRFTPTQAGYESIKWGSETVVTAQVADLVSLDKGTYGKAITHNRPLHVAIGVGLAGALQWLCIAIPGWPLHPIGIILALTFFGNVGWLSIFIGWAIKTFVVRLGGSRLLRAAKPFFMGLIAGEIIILMVWAVVAAVLAFSGLPYVKVDLQPK